MNVVTQLTQFVGHDVINKNMTDLAVYAVQLGQLSSVELCRYKRALSHIQGYVKHLHLCSCNVRCLSRS